MPLWGMANDLHSPHSPSGASFRHAQWSRGSSQDSSIVTRQGIPGADGHTGGYMHMLPREGMVFVGIWDTTSAARYNTIHHPAHAWIRRHPPTHPEEQQRDTHREHFMGQAGGDRLPQPGDPLQRQQS